MSRVLCETIAKQNVIFFRNFKICLDTCNLDYILCDMPIWKHVYHTLHSCDMWFINPFNYEEPSFHTLELNSLEKAPDDVILGYDDLTTYLARVEEKITDYIDNLTDEELGEKPDGCKYTRFELVLGQYRHWYCHLGNINCTTIVETNKWPKVIGLEEDKFEGLYE